MIPKKIHYVWLGHGAMSDTIKLCLNSWRELLPDYDILRWDETNYDIGKAPRFVQEAYNAKKWAFASDYIRLWALYNYGGIYLDTDTEVKKNLDIFLKNKFFIGTQVFCVDVNKMQREKVVNLSMGIIGSEAGHPYLKDCMDQIERSHIVRNNGTIDTKVTNYVMSDILQTQYGFQVEDKRQNLREDIIVYPSSVFADRLSPIHYTNAYTFHWGEMSWFQPKSRGPIYRLCWHLNLMKVYHWIERKNK